MSITVKSRKLFYCLSKATVKEGLDLSEINRAVRLAYSYDDVR